MALLEEPQQEVDGGSVGRMRLRIEGQRFALQLLDPAADGRQLVGDIGDIVGQHGERADIFLKFGSLDSRPVLYWRETYQHRIFRQGLFAIDASSANGNWNHVLTPLCEGKGGIETSH